MLNIDTITIRPLDIDIDTTTETMLIALVDEQVIGTVSVGYKEKRAAYIRLFYVHPDWRRLGVGTKLLNKCIDIAKEEGCETVGLQLEKENITARDMYTKLGFIFAYEYDDESSLLIKLLK